MVHSKIHFTIDQVRAVTELELQQIVGIVNRAYFFGEQGLWQDNTARTNTNEMFGFCNNGEIFTATIDDSIIGCVRLTKFNDRVAEFGMLATHRDFLKQGVASKLIEQTESIAKNNLCCDVMQLEILDPIGWKHDEKEFLKSWYAKLGYEFVEHGSIEQAYPHLAPLLATRCNYLIYQKIL